MPLRAARIGGRRAQAGVHASTALRACGGGTGPAMHACTEGKGQCMFMLYAAATHRRRVGEVGNLAAPEAHLWCEGEVMVFSGGEREASRFFRKGVSHVVHAVRTYGRE
jgi:hypothetical protein